MATRSNREMISRGSGIARRRLVMKEEEMETADTVIAVVADHDAAETAVKKLTAAGFEMKNLSVVGKGYDTEERGRRLLQRR
jgi:hypoxanthine-guanine phosphoribosyltransferase